MHATTVASSTGHSRPQGVDAPGAQHLDGADLSVRSLGLGARFLSKGRVACACYITYMVAWHCSASWSSWSAVWLLKRMSSRSMTSGKLLLPPL
jgi:hypothetical protein